MFSITNIGRTLLAKIVAFLYVITSVIFAGFPFGAGEDPAAPKDFTPVIRFAVCSDIHLNGEEDQPEAARLKKLIDFMYGYCADQSYTGFDALVCVGDVATTGYEKEYALFNSIIAEKLKEETQLMICTGNHEYIATRDYDAAESARLFEKMEGPLDNHYTLKGYHFILASYDDNGKTFSGKLDWLEEQISSAEKDSGSKPVFVFQHPGPFATVYGSINWGDFDITKVLSKHPRVVDFSGHSHYPINDPRTIWQGGYTALGCGTLSYFETELDAIAGNFPYETENAAQFYIVEGDKDGNLRIKSYDLITDAFFDNEYYLTDLADKNFDYTYFKRKNRDSAPVWPAGTKAETYKNDKGETLLKFTGAEDKYVVESYKLSVTENGIPFFSDNFSGKYMYLYEENQYEVNLGTLTQGKKYSVQIVALNAYAETSSPFTYSFTA